MKKELNISEILQDKPQGIRLYSPIFGECTFCYVREDTDDICVKKHNGKKKTFFNSEGLYNTLGEVMLFPSREMRDWSKFAWKKGDVLVHNGIVHIIFEGFEDDTYRTFKGKYYLWEDNGHIEQFDIYPCYKETSIFIKANDDDTQTYISTIEKKLGGKLNRETLEIEKAQPEFKDGDILSCDEDSYTKHTTLIFHKNGDTRESIVSLIRHKELIEANEHINDFLLSRLNYAREDEKKELFDALAKKGKTWDAEKKEVVDLKPKCDFKPFDRCIWKIRNCEGSIWQASFVSYVDEYGATPMGMSIDEDLVNLIILPYNDQTKLLVGTTDEWKGGEQ